MRNGEVFRPFIKRSLAYPRTTIWMNGQLDFANFNWGRISNSNTTMTNSLNLCETFKNTFSGMPKVRAWSIFTLFMS